MPLRAPSKVLLACAATESRFPLNAYPFSFFAPLSQQDCSYRHRWRLSFKSIAKEKLIQIHAHNLFEIGERLLQ